MEKFEKKKVGAICGVSKGGVSSLRFDLDEVNPARYKF
jgi:hypothetical protein